MGKKRGVKNVSGLNGPETIYFDRQATFKFNVAEAEWLGNYFFMCQVKARQQEAFIMKKFAPFRRHSAAFGET